MLWEKLVSLQIPPMLKKQLVDDCEFITHLGKVIMYVLFPILMVH